MARAPYLIAGLEIPLRESLELSQAEAASLEETGRVNISRPLEWPIPSSLPDFASAYIDAGGTDIWGGGPYLKVPNRTPAGNELVNRIFCPWGYPPDELEITPIGVRAMIEEVSVERVSANSWRWTLRLRKGHRSEA